MLDRRRRRYLIDRFQGRIILMQITYLVVFLFVQALLVFGPLTRKLEEGGMVGREQLATATLFLEIHKTFWPVLIVLLLVAAVHSTIVSHRLVGPLVRVRHVLRALRDGERPKRVKFRDKDYLTEEASLLEELSGALRSKEQAEAERWDRVREWSVELEAAVRNERFEQCGGLIAQIRTACGEPTSTDADEAGTRAAEPTPA